MFLFFRMSTNKLIRTYKLKSIGILLSLLTIAPVKSVAQTPLHAGYSYLEPVITLEDSSTQKYIYIDTSFSLNSWVIAPPQKTIFNSAYSPVKALITDSINFYPVNDQSRFYLTVIKEWSNCDILIMEFHHKFNTDSLYDGGNIEISVDYGASWGNILDSAFLANYNLEHHYDFMGYNFYGEYDTVASLNSPGFTGNSNGWITSGFNLLSAFCTMDTLFFRFNFFSDSINTNKEGWVIDNLVVDGIIISVPEVEYNHLSLFPNPTTGRYSIISRNRISMYELFDLTGKLIETAYPNSIRFENDISYIKPGMYFYRITTDNGQHQTGKIIRE